MQRPGGVKYLFTSNFYVKLLPAPSFTQNRKDIYIKENIFTFLTSFSKKKPPKPNNKPPTNQNTPHKKTYPGLIKHLKNSQIFKLTQHTGCMLIAKLLWKSGPFTDPKFLKMEPHALHSCWTLLPPLLFIHVPTTKKGTCSIVPDENEVLNICSWEHGSWFIHLLSSADGHVSLYFHLQACQ